VNNDETSSGSSNFPPPPSPSSLPPISTITKLGPTEHGQHQKQQQENLNFRRGKRQSVINGPFRALAFTQGALAQLCTENADMIRCIGLTALLVLWHAFLGKNSNLFT
jgi:hypothetical protein